jgi:hypothetical protein
MAVPCRRATSPSRIANTALVQVTVRISSPFHYFVKLAALQVAPRAAPPSLDADRTDQLATYWCDPIQHSLLIGDKVSYLGGPWSMQYFGHVFNSGIYASMFWIKKIAL